MTFLIVEDNVSQMESLVALLRLAKHTVRYCMSTDAAKKIAVVHPPDAVILDLVIPPYPPGGLELLRWMRVQEQFRNTPVVVTTALPDDAVPPMEGLGPVELLGKLFYLEDLTASVNRMLGRPIQEPGQNMGEAL